jgi:histidine ammonia-lyase
MEAFHIEPRDYRIDELADAINKRLPIKLGDASLALIITCKEYLDHRIQRDASAIYGINTGFGSLCDTIISSSELGQLQRNLVLSHACGTGDHIPQDVVRWMLLLKIIGLSRGHSGVQPETVQRLVDLYNHQLLPVIYEQGSLGASGDLAPLAHLSIPLIGEGQLWVEGAIKPTKEVYWSLGWDPIDLAAKEGLALLNGTQFMSAYGCTLVVESLNLLSWANAIAAMSAEAFDARPEPFADALHQLRRQSGQIEVAQRMRELLMGSAIMHSEKIHVQDPYSFRCIPQVHGASLDAIRYAQGVIDNEVNAVTDNPTVFPDDDAILSGGNFHGQPLALAHDFMAIALAEIGSISERRTFKLLSGTRKLPAFLSPQPGLNSGFMIPQYTAASMVSQNKQLCTPASVDTIDSSNGQEDHVSMGANAAVKAYKVLQNVRRILGIELLCAAQALDFRGVDRAAPASKELHTRFRKQVPFLESDEYLRPIVQKSIVFIQNNRPKT